VAKAGCLPAQRQPDDDGIAGVAEEARTLGSRRSQAANGGTAGLSGPILSVAFDRYQLTSQSVVIATSQTDNQSAPGDLIAIVQGCRQATGKCEDSSNA
jgi:hypothetical protein